MGIIGIDYTHGYHSSGLRICDREDIQGFSDIPIRERIKYITDTVENHLDDITNGNEEDLSTGARLSFTKDSPHAKFVHFHTVTPTKATTPSKTAKYDHNSTLEDNLFKFSDDESQDTSDKFQDDDSIRTETSQHSWALDNYTMDKSKHVDIPNDEDSYDTSKLDQILPHDNETSELEMWKDEVKKLKGDKVNVPYEKSKRIEWTVEKILSRIKIHTLKNLEIFTQFMIIGVWILRK